MRNMAASPGALTDQFGGTRLVNLPKRAAAFLTSALIVLLLGAPALSQVAGGRRGEATLVVQVTDPNGDVIVVAKVRLRGPDGQERVLETGGQGLLTFTGLTP